MSEICLRLTDTPPRPLPSLADWAKAPPAEASEPLVVLNASSPGRVRLASAYEGYRIPHTDAPRLGPAAFALPRVVPAWVSADPVMGSPRAPARRVPSQASWCAGLSLMLIPTAALAAPAVDAAAPSAEPTSTVEASPAQSTPSESQTPEPTADSDATKPSGQRSDPVADPQPLVSAIPPQVAVDAAWEGVVGYDVVMTMADDTKVEGRISAVQVHTFTVIDLAGGGVVRVMSKRDVTSVRVRTPPPLPKRSGVGLLAGGGTLTALGSPVAVAGLVFLGVYPSGYYIHVPLLLVGGALAGVGTALLVKGLRTRRLYNEALVKRRLSLTPTMGRTRHGAWTGGLTLQF
ncbi:MAG: hypothetical protein B7733_12710 [Myxococcales bacterium FL481]|nr:MAG: hypothetical protein B7733_12710 [Myxococcales bacterium FL481]